MGRRPGLRPGDAPVLCGNAGGPHPGVGRHGGLELRERQQRGRLLRGGSVFTAPVDFATYNRFTSCMQRFAACNNIFLIRDGKVVQYSPVGTGGAYCVTDARMRPGGATAGGKLLTRSEAQGTTARYSETFSPMA